MQLNRAYSLLTIKSLQEEERLIEGMASTPEVDRVGDIVEPLGAKFKVPMPLLWMHKADSPVGHVEFAQPTKEGIPFRARIAKIEEPGELKNLVDKAWQAVKAKLVGAVSIGFSIDKYEVMKEGGWKINEWFWHELSLVTIPANTSATIHTIRSLDAEVLAASGQKQDSKDRVVPAGVTAKSPQPVVKAKEAKRMAKKSTADQIAAFENTRAAKAAARDDIMEKAGETNETLDAQQTEEYDGLVAEIKAIDAHLVRLRELEENNKQKAVAVHAATPEEASHSRSNVRVSVNQRTVEPWRQFARIIIANVQAKGNPMLAAELASHNQQWMEENPQLPAIIKAGIAPATTTDPTWAGPLVQYQVYAQAFAELLRPLTIIGRIPGLRRVPFKIRIPRQTGGATVGWVGEAAPKPLSALAFDTITMDQTKVAGIVPLSEDVMRLSDPSIEDLVRNDLSEAIVVAMDSAFVDPSNAGQTGVKPASITNGVTAIVPSGTTASALRTDVTRLFNSFLVNNLSLASAVWLMTQQTATTISLKTNTLGQPEFPAITPTGGSFAGIPVVASENIPATTGSPTEGYPMILLAANEILLADDGTVRVDASREATLQMDSAPDSPATASTVMFSLFQNNAVAIRAERWINWAKRRSTAVGYISAAVYNT